MKRTFTLLFTLLVCSLVISCQKEITDTAGTTTNPTTPTNPTTSITDIRGIYKFVSMHVKSTSSAEVAMGSDKVKNVSLFDYVTENNSGTVTIEDAKMTSADIAYTINTISQTSSYLNGTLTDTISVPFQFTIPATTSTSAYRRIGADSLYFEQGSSFTGQVSQNTIPTGAKIKVDQDKLYITQMLSVAKNDNSSGSATTVTSQGTYIITLQRQ